VCEEANRWILRWDPTTRTVERLAIDWSPVKKFFSHDPNASFEGLAVGQGKLYVANERSVGRIIVVDLETLRVEADFAVRPFGSVARDLDYSDLSWFDGSLYVLLRESRKVLQVEPKSRRVLAEFDYGAIERAPEYAYQNPYPTGAMEGLAVDREFIWLLTDNNGQRRIKYPGDSRPTLFRCPRPAR
jgi:glutamine cyclotransferase